MTLTTEELDIVNDVGAAELDEVLEQDGFGKFAILNHTEQEFIQAGNDWQLNEACRAFIDAHDSDPWVLEYREAEQQFRAVGWVTLGQVRQAFQSYLAGESEWRTGFAWVKLEL